ncbi:MAG TPA: aminodeoxychorismate/anthranilate synthase component II [Chthoniobacterales bacterium]|jgi:anthranilate synthase/aminodeoxychorismate synthase-like glutamine amidotransferase|nr:aminodeoxychorismate/anthranilate synthase component II [Chthoniobacterales bacterium]
MILVLDNYDSFTYNLVQYFGELGAELVVRRNDRTSIDEVEELHPEKICISPGPGTPDEAGISNDLIRHFGPRIPVLGVCLGHQCIGQVYGGEVVRAERIMHGKTSPILHEGDGVFRGLPIPFEATRYHSLIVRRETLPEELEVVAETSDREIMGLRHRQYPVHGVQFHPESIMTGEGKRLLANFLSF